MQKHVWEKIAENLDFVEHNNFIRRSTKSAVRRCPGINQREIPMAESYYSKLARLKPITLLQ